MKNIIILLLFILLCSNTFFNWRGIIVGEQYIVHTTDEAVTNLGYKYISTIYLKTNPNKNYLYLMSDSLYKEGDIITFNP